MGVSLALLALILDLLLGHHEVALRLPELIGVVDGCYQNHRQEHPTPDPHRRLGKECAHPGNVHRCIKDRIVEYRAHLIPGEPANRTELHEIHRCRKQGLKGKDSFESRYGIQALPIEANGVAQHPEAALHQARHQAAHPRGDHRRGHATDQSHGRFGGFVLEVVDVDRRVVEMKKNRLEHAGQILEQLPTVGLKRPHSGHEHECSLNLLRLGELPLAQGIAQPPVCRLLCLIATLFGHTRLRVRRGVSKNLSDADKIVRNPSQEIGRVIANKAHAHR